MKPAFVSSVACTVLMVALSTHSAFAAPETVTSGPEAAAVIGVSDLAAQNGVVSAVLVNRSRRLVKDVKLLVRHAWLWNNERHPGTDNPGRAEYYVARGQIPVGGSLPFTYHPQPPLPRRSDGRFTTTVEVVGFTEVGD